MKRIRVWDPLVRILHWTLVFCVVSNFLNESGHAVHRFLGLTAASVVVIRLVWGFIGPEYARFSNWFPTPARLIPYVKALLRNEAPRHIGHNPAGAVMMLVLMALVLSLGTSGYMMTTDAFMDTEWLIELHELIGKVLIACVLMHVGAAIYESRKHRENLVASMIHGHKPLHSPAAEKKPEDQA